MFLIHKTFIGDIAEGSKHLPFGLSRARQLHRAGLSTTENHVIDKVKIRIHVIGDNGYVRIETLCKPRLESGALDLGTFNLFYARDIKACDVWRAGVTEIVDHPIIGTLKLPLGDPYVSKVYGLKQPPTPLPVQPPPNPADFVNESGGLDNASYQAALYPDQAKLSRVKRNLFFLNPSKATGKMRLFLQALAGSHPERVDSGGYLDEYLRLSSFDYIIRDANGEYWLTDKQAWYHMRFSPCADKIKAVLRAGGLDREEESRLEAVLFSYITVEPPSKETVDAFTSMVGRPRPPGWFDQPWPADLYGSAIAYDWHFAYQQARGIRVCHTVDPAEDFYTLWDSHYEEVTFTTMPNIDGVAQPPVATYRQLETAKWSRVTGQDVIWHIDPNTNTQFPDRELRGKVGAYDSPVYVFFDYRDIPVVIRYSKSGATLAPVDSGDDGREVGDCGAGVVIQKTTGVGKFTSGFYVTGGHTYDGRGDSAPSVLIVDQKYTREYGVVNNPPIPEPNPTAPGGETQVFHYGCNWVSGPTYVVVSLSVGANHGSITGGVDQVVTRTDTSGSQTHFSFLLFPLDNPDAVYLGSQQVSDRAGGESTTRTGNVYQLDRIVLSTGQIVDYEHNFLGNSPLTNTVDYGSHTYRNIDSPEDFTLITQHRVITKVGHLTMSQQDGGVENWSPIPDWHTLFHPDGSDQIYWSRMYKAIESTNGRLHYKDGDNMMASVGGFPKDNNTYFIGYA